MNNHVVLLDIQSNMRAVQEGASTGNQSVSATSRLPTTSTDLLQAETRSVAAIMKGPHFYTGIEFHQENHLPRRLGSVLAATT